MHPSADQGQQVIGQSAPPRRIKLVTQSQLAADHAYYTTYMRRKALSYSSSSSSSSMADDAYFTPTNHRQALVSLSSSPSMVDDAYFTAIKHTQALSLSSPSMGDGAYFTAIKHRRALSSSSSSPHTDPEETRPNSPAYINSSGFDINIVIITAAILFVLLAALAMNTVIKWMLRSCWMVGGGSRRRHGGSDNNMPAAADQGMKKKEIRALPTIIYRSSDKSYTAPPGHGTPKEGEGPNADNVSSSDSSCAICLADFRDGDRVRVLPQCHHRFHVSCVDTWLARHSSCPICRGQLMGTMETEEPKPHVQLHILVTTLQPSTTSSTLVVSDGATSTSSSTTLVVAHGAPNTSSSSTPRMSDGASSTSSSSTLVVSNEATSTSSSSTQVVSNEATSTRSSSTLVASNEATSTISKSSPLLYSNEVSAINSSTTLVVSHGPPTTSSTVTLVVSKETSAMSTFNV